MWEKGSWEAKKKKRDFLDKKECNWVGKEYGTLVQQLPEMNLHYRRFSLARNIL